MDLKSYHEKTAKFVNPELSRAQVIQEFSLGVITELGEAMDEVKKALNGKSPLRKAHLALEAGDAMFYLVHKMYAEEGEPGVARLESMLKYSGISQPLTLSSAADQFTGNPKDFTVPLRVLAGEGLDLGFVLEANFEKLEAIFSETPEDLRL